MVEKLKHTQAPEFAPDKGEVGTLQNRIRNNVYAVAEGLGHGVETTAVASSHIIGRTIRSIGLGAYHLITGVQGKPIRNKKAA